jgi:DNA-binding transcriptional MerR regulator
MLHESVLSSKAEMAERLTIDELARRAGMTVRNVRAHQSRGLLPPPELMARTGYYGPEHVARLELIREMQAAGFNLAAIKRLLEAAPPGARREALEFHRALLRPWEAEEPRVYEASEVLRWFGGQVSAELVERAQALGLVTLRDDGTVEVRSPSLLKAGAEVVRLGVPVERVQEVFEELMTHSRRIAGTFIRLFLEEVWRPLDREDAGRQDWLRARQALERLRGVASDALLAVFQLTMTAAVEEAVGRQLDASAAAGEAAG